jgi:hypothetical protein
MLHKFEKDLTEITRLLKHGHHDQSTHGNRYRTIAGKPRKIHIGGTVGTIEYDHEGKPLKYGPEPPPKLNSDPSKMDAKIVEEKDEILSKQTEIWKSKLHDDELQSIKNYTGVEYVEMNSALREDRVDSSSNRNEIKAAQAGLLKGSLETPITVYRGLNVYGTTYDKVLNMMSGGVGQTFTDKAFVSTSINKSNAFGGNIRLNIVLPEGTKGAYVDPVSDVPGEREYLLPHSTKFKIIDHEVSVSNYHTFTLQAVPTEYK